MKKVLFKVLSLTLSLVLVFSVASAALIASAASVGKVTSLQSYNIDDDEINLKWKKVKNADGYQVYIYSSNKWKYLGATKKLSFEADDLVSAKQYKFKVRAYDLKGNKKLYGPFSSVLVSATDPDEVENLKVSSKGKKTVALKWSAEKRATGYQVYLYDSSAKKYVKKAVVKNPSATIKNLKAGTSYKFKVRAYFKSDSKYYYGEFSDVLSVKTKANAAKASDSKSTSAPAASDKLISSAKAKSIALNHAKLKSSQVRGLECHLDYEKGVKVYEIEFEYGRYDYDYEINAKSGKIIHYEREHD